MPQLKIIRDGTGAFPELANTPEKVIHMRDPAMSFIRFKGGMQSGDSSVMIRIDLPDGRVVLAETSMKLFWGAATVFRRDDVDQKIDRMGIEEQKAKMLVVGRTIEDVISRTTGFVIVTCNMGPGEERQMAFTTNCDVNDAIKMLREMAYKMERERDRTS